MAQLTDLPYQRFLFGALLFSTALFAIAAQSTQAPDWDALHTMSLPELREANAQRPSPRYQVSLAVREADRSASDANRYLTNAMANATPGSDAALLARVLECALSDLIPTSLSNAECTERGQAIERITHPRPAMQAYLNYGIWLANSGQYTQASQANRAAETLALSAGDKSLAASIQNNQGVDYLIRGLPAQALKKFQAALEYLDDSEDDQSLLVSLTSNIASTHVQLGDFEAASTLLQDLMTSPDYNQNNPANLIDEVVLANAKLALGSAQEAFTRLNAVLKATAPHSFTGMQAYGYSVLGDLQIELGNTEAGIKSFERARELAKNSNDAVRVNKVEVAYANALVNLKRYSEAGAILDASIGSLEAQGTSAILAQALELRGDVLRAAGKRQAANAEKRRARQMQIKVAGAEYDLELAMLGKSLELANQANELARVRQATRQSEARAQRDISLRNQLILIALLLAFITYLGLSRRYERKVAKTIQTANAKLEAKVAERTAAMELEMAQRLEAESERQSLAQSLAEGEKLQALGQLTSGVAHDFNNLMTVVTLSADALRDREPIAKSESIREVENILAAAESAADITASLLSYARQQPLTPQPTDLEKFIAEASPLFRRSLGESVTLDISTQPCVVLVDRGQLTTAIINLLLNSKEALNGRGRVHLQVAQTVQADQNGDSAHWATIAVTDHGTGMTDAEQRRAVEPFYTTKEPGQGTGLGLSMVDGFAKQSDGFIHIDSAKGKHTVVTLFVPIYRLSQVPQAPVVESNDSWPTDGLVIVVDDQQPIRQVLSQLLKKMGLEVATASSGIDAMRLLEKSQCASLLITDLMMPGEVNGQQLIAEVRDRYPDLAVLAMSGYSDSIETDAEFLHKPFSADELREAMKRACARDQGS